MTNSKYEFANDVSSQALRLGIRGIFMDCKG